MLYQIIQIFIKILLTIAIVGISYFAIWRVWSSDIDIIGWLKKPSETIPIERKKIEIPANDDRPIVYFSGWGKFQKLSKFQTIRFRLENTGNREAFRGHNTPLF